MTCKEAILKSLEKLETPSNSTQVYNHIIENKLYDFKDGKTPAATVSANLGHFIRIGDSRVKRTKTSNGTFLYYLSKNEQKIDIEGLSELISEKKNPKNTYHERDLHVLLNTYLKNQNIFAKTIFHESSNRKDTHQKWVHPDMIGIKFLKLRAQTSQAFLKAINRVETFKLISYEIKREINSDYELKEAFFQAVSNSSWANYGYLVAFEISDDLSEEMSRLNESFGIGIIELKSNPYESKVLFQPKYKDLDFKTIDKLCDINPDFAKFVEQVEKLMTATERYLQATERELEELCDKYFLTDSEITEYCRQKNIPIETED